VERSGEARFQEVVVPGFVQIGTLERALKIDRQKLRDLNPALLRAVWDGKRHVPKAYRLRLPMDGGKWTNDILATRLTPGDFFAGQPEPRRYRVRRGDTVATVADQYGVTPEALARLNRIRTSGKLKVGRVLNLPESTAGTGTVVTVASTSSSNVAVGRPTPASAALAAPAGGAATAGTAAVASNAPRTGTAATASIGVLNGGAVSGAPEATVAEDALAKSGTGTNFLNDGSGNAGVTTDAAAGGASGAATVPRRGLVTSPSGIYVVQSGESLADIASKFGMTEAQLLRLNGVRNRDFVFEGQQLLVTATPPSAVASTSRPSPAAVAPPAEKASSSAPPAQTAPVAVVDSGAVPAEEAAREGIEEAKAVAKAEVPSENAQPVNAAQAEELSPALGPSADTQQNADPTDYSVSKDNTIRVAAAETLGHYADWLHMSPARLRQLNKMSFAKPVLIGHKIKLDFGRVSREEFETKRREYHVELQATYFAEHRIVGTEVYIVRRGDALWTVTQRFAQLPIWLLQQYNPDVDLADLHPGTQIVMPRVENVVAGPAG
jgi:LysM repeat protein